MKKYGVLARMVERRSDKAPESAEHAEQPGDRAHTAPERSSHGATERRSARAAEVEAEHRSGQSSRGERSSAKTAEVRTLPGASVVERPSENLNIARQLWSMRIKQSEHGTIIKAGTQTAKRTRVHARIQLVKEVSKQRTQARQSK